MSQKTENNAFICQNCGCKVAPIKRGGYRNHCPHCLYSKHLDNKPGDRAANCHGLMKPIAIKMHGKKGLQIVHKCLRCGKEQKNIIACDDSDNYNLILQLPTV